MKLIGLRFKEIVTVLNGDIVYETRTVGLGGGEWAIEAYDAQGFFLHEFVGLNGTRGGEEPSDLWAEFAEWASKVSHRYKVFIAPDGTEGPLSFFWREAERDNLHGCMLSL